MFLDAIRCFNMEFLTHSLNETIHMTLLYMKSTIPTWLEQEMWLLHGRGSCHRRRLRRPIIANWR